MDRSSSSSVEDMMVGSTKVRCFVQRAGHNRQREQTSSEALFHEAGGYCRDTCVLSCFWGIYVKFLARSRRPCAMLFGRDHLR